MLMLYPKMLKVQARKLAKDEDLSAEQIAEIFSKEVQKGKHDFLPTPRTIRNWLKQSDRTDVAAKNQVEFGQDLLVVKARETHDIEIYTHDRKVFKKSDKILNEERLETFFNRLLVGNRYYLIEVDMLFKYFRFFDRESNKYVSSELRYLCERFCKIIESLSRFIGIHSDVVVSWEEGLGTKYKLVPGGDFDRFYNELTNDDTRVRAESRLSDKADRLVYECRDAYREYRSSVRETLYL